MKDHMAIFISLNLDIIISGKDLVPHLTLMTTKIRSNQFDNNFENSLENGFYNNNNNNGLTLML